MKFKPRYALIALVALVALGGLLRLLPGVPLSLAIDSTKQPDAIFNDGPCAKSGVTEVVDFGTSANRETIQRCLPSFTGSGWQALVTAGLAVEGTKQYPTGFTCRINGWPTESAQRCIEVPQYRDGYWAYFYADSKTGGWRYSPAGSSMRKPACGSFEGWRFLVAGESAASHLPRTNPTPFNCD